MTVDLAGVTPPTERELFSISFQLRYERVQALIGIGDTRRRIVRTLLVEGDGWSINGMSEFLRIPRTTMQKAFRVLINLKIVRRDREGVHLTDRGRGLFLLIHRETIHICLGEQIGYSSNLISVLGKFYKEGFAPAPFAAEINFLKDLPFKIETY